MNQEIDDGDHGIVTAAMKSAVSILGGANKGSDGDDDDDDLLANTYWAA